MDCQKDSEVAIQSVSNEDGVVKMGEQAVSEGFAPEYTKPESACSEGQDEPRKFINICKRSYRRETFKDWSFNVKGNNEMLSLTQPATIKKIYKRYLTSGSRLIGTNTFNSTTIAMTDYKMEEYVYGLNYAGARLAREACDEMTAEDSSFNSNMHSQCPNIHIYRALAC